ncbi:MAG: hypothetical protein WD266_06980, partial [Balneolales bacterium]
MQFFWSHHHPSKIDTVHQVGEEERLRGVADGIRLTFVVVLGQSPLAVGEVNEIEKQLMGSLRTVP